MISILLKQHPLNMNMTKYHTYRRDSKKVKRTMHTANITRADLNHIENSRGRFTLKKLKLLDNGLTKEVYIHNSKKRVFKHHKKATDKTDFETKPGVRRKMEKLGLFLREQKITNKMYSAQYCESLWKDTHTVRDIIRWNIVVIQFADALAQHDIYAMDLHLGNVGKCASDGNYRIIDNEGFFHALTSREQPEATMREKVIVQVNKVDVPHSQPNTWLHVFDVSQGWFSQSEDGEWAKNMLTYVSKMSQVRTLADIRLRNFVSQYFALGVHIAYGLRLLQITKVYADATPTTKDVVNQFLSFYYSEHTNGQFLYVHLEKKTHEEFDFSKAWLLDRAHRKNYDTSVERLVVALLPHPSFDFLREAYSTNHSTLSSWQTIKNAFGYVGYLSLALGFIVYEYHQRKQGESILGFPKSLFHHNKR